jgi:hypothetical protein
MTEETFKILPYYTGDQTLDAALDNKKSRDLLWLEILFNDRIEWERHLNVPAIRTAHEKARVWYGHFKTMIDGATGRRPLPHAAGQIDDRDYRKFLEALNFVAD